MSFSSPSPAGSAPIVERIKNILLKPVETWDAIDVEPSDVGSIFRGYVVPLAAIPVVAGVIHGLVFGSGGFGLVVRLNPISVLIQGAVSYALGLLMISVMAMIIDGLAPNFGGQSNRVQAFKVAAYSATASWVAGAFNAVPILGALSILGSLYSLYLLYLGLPKLMKAPAERALGYTAVTILVAIVFTIIIGVALGTVGAVFGGAAGLGGGMFHHEAQVTGTMHLPGGVSVDMDKLNAAAKQAEVASEQMKSAQEGKPGAIKAVTPETLKGLMPDSLSGYSRTELSAESQAVNGMSNSHVQGVYTKGDNRISLEVSDLAALGALAAMGGVRISKETATGYEKAGKVDGRMTTESFDRQSKHGKYSVIVADRFMVLAEGDRVSMDDLKGAVSSIGFGRLEGLAKAG
ncbi:MAG: Yip1 family protein [Caulobacteraceae bacterium]|nr:Yip1 family protein [Caulobacteraceae bacterium]